MNIQEYGKLSAMEDYYWWHVGRKSIIRQQLKKLALPAGSRILNIGCGTGGTSEILNEFGQVVNADTSDMAIEFSRARGIPNLVKVDDVKLPFENNSFDLVIGLDVLEHIPNDAEALDEWHRVLKNNGKLFLTVPAYQWLWSEHDESLQHYRRYTVPHLLRVSHKFETLKKSYMIVFAFFPIIFYRLLRKVFPTNKSGIETSYVMLPALFNNLLIKFLQFEGVILRHANFPFGTSILLIANKKQ